jgi:glucose-6-phosphate isomerase
MLNTHYFTSNAHDGLFNRIKLETENIGYYNLPEQNLDYLSNYLEKLDDKHKLESITDFIVVGIGGSSLGVESSKKILMKKLKSKK